MPRAGFDGGRNTVIERWLVMAMFKHQQVAAIREMRGKMWSPGRLSTARREDRVLVLEGDRGGVVGASTRPSRRGCRRRWGLVGSVMLVGCHHLICVCCRVGICRLPSGRDRDSQCSAGLGCGEIARRLGRAPSTISRKLVVTPPSQRPYSPIGRRSLSGMPNGVLLVPSRPSWLSTTG